MVKFVCVTVEPHFVRDYQSDDSRLVGHLHQLSYPVLEHKQHKLLTALVNPEIRKRVDNVPDPEILRSIYEEYMAEPGEARRKGAGLAKRLSQALVRHYQKHRDDFREAEFRVVGLRVEVKFLVEPRHRASDPVRVAAEQFFGTGAMQDDVAENPGLIVLPTNSIVDLVKITARDDSDTAQSETLRTAPQSGLDRAYKARYWVNAFDAAGAYALIEMFARHTTNIPRLVFDSDRIHREGPDPAFEITLGGFEEKANAQVDQIGQGWAKFESSPEYGDVFMVHRQSLPETCERLIFRESGNGYAYILPNQIRSGGASYIKKYREHPKRFSRPDGLRDYAVILRHTELQTGRRSVRFYLFGFTEFGTTAAAYYLAKHWERFGEEQPSDDPSFGDFCSLIEGPIESVKDLDATHWSQVHCITPQLLYDRKVTECEWAQRMSAHVVSKRRPSKP